MTSDPVSLLGVEGSIPHCFKFTVRVSMYGLIGLHCGRVPAASCPRNTSGFLPICQNQIKGLFKDFQGPHEGYIRTKLNQTDTFISIYKRHKLPPAGSGAKPWPKMDFMHI